LVAAGISVIALVGLGVVLPRFRDSAARAPAANERADPRRVAVLDFEDQSPDRSVGHIASGLTGSLIRELTGAGAIQVMSRNSVRTFRERGLPFDSLVTALRIGSLVEGSVQRSNDLLRVTVQLVDADTKTHLESVTIERPMGELFMLEDELARQVAALLRRRIGDEVRIRETTAGTRSARARELVFRAEKLRGDAAAMVASTDTDDVSAASEALWRADSLLAAAQVADRRWTVPATERGWVALALAQNDSGSAREEAFARATAYANDVLTQEPGNASAFQLRGATAYWKAARLRLADSAFRRALAQARADLVAAVAADSTLAAAWGTLGLVHVALGEVTLASRAARTALAMDSYLEEAPAILLALYGTTLMNGSLPEAWRWCERGGQDYPADHRFLDCRLTLLAEDESRAPDPPQTWALVARTNELDPPARARATGRPWLPIYRLMMGAVVSARAGDRDNARAVARRARELAGDDRELRTDLAYEEAYLHLVLGESRDAIASLGIYLAERPSLKELVSRHPRWRSLRSDTAFRRLVGRATPGRS
jgi:TolB-like protein